VNATIGVLGAWRLHCPDPGVHSVSTQPADRRAAADGRSDAQGTCRSIERARPVRIAVQRLLAFLVLRGRVQQRALVAGNLWPESSDRRANANLRSALWHARNEWPDVVDGDGSTIWLCEGVASDFDEATAAVRAVLLGEQVTAAHLTTLVDDVLPTWEDEWVLPVRFVHRQLRLLALERAPRDAGVTMLSPR
jgi:DNA-binding SARP family transcriptional activator